MQPAYTRSHPFTDRNEEQERPALSTGPYRDAKTVYEKNGRAAGICGIQGPKKLAAIEDSFDFFFLGIVGGKAFPLFQPDRITASGDPAGFPAPHSSGDTPQRPDSWRGHPAP